MTVGYLAHNCHLLVLSFNSFFFLKSLILFSVVNFSLIVHLSIRYKGDNYFSQAQNVILLFSRLVDGGYYVLHLGAGSLYLFYFCTFHFFPFDLY